MEVCERCGKPKNPASLATLEYYHITIHVCFPCIARVAGLMRNTPLGERMGELRKRKEQWHTAREERERQAS